jgi:prepilin-type N-terminal cleavage/methylation domain-containing protein
MNMNTTNLISRRALTVAWIGQDWPVTIRRKSARRFPSEILETRVEDGSSLSVLRGRGIARHSFTNSFSFMNTRHTYRSTRPQAFTLIEMLVVIAIIAILAGILLPVLGGIKVKAKIKQAQMEMVNLAGAIKAYEKEYNRFPGSAKVEQNGNPDFTFGYGGIVTGKAYESDNSLVMFILLNHMDKAPVPLRDEIKNRNPRSLSLFDARMVSGDQSGISTDDHIFRDPWGNPYVITIDLDGNDKCLDGYYRTVGGAGLTGTAPNIEFSGDVMIWSFGPDKKYGAGFDKDNILSWK